MRSRAAAAASAAASEPRGDVEIDDANRAFVEDALKAVDDWLQTAPAGTSIRVPAETSFRRLLIHQEVKKRYNSFLATQGEQGAVQVSRLTVEERELHKDQSKKIEAEISEMVGLRKVIDLISNSGKPLVGHNMWLVPDLATMEASGTGGYHNAGFDAYATGAAFARMVAKLTAEGAGGEGSGGDVAADCGRLRLDHAALARATNRIFLMNSEVTGMNLVGTDDEPDRSRVLHVSGFPASWRTRHVREALAPTLGRSVRIRWLDDTSCLVTPPAEQDTAAVGSDGGGGVMTVEALAAAADATAAGTYRVRTYVQFERDAAEEAAAAAAAEEEEEGSRGGGGGS
ncbi:hypothetical protein HK405_012265, partial [Cladochytrium tenue]